MRIRAIKELVKILSNIVKSQVVSLKGFIPDITFYLIGIIAVGKYSTGNKLWTHIVVFISVFLSILSARVFLHLVNSYKKSRIELENYNKNISIIIEETLKRAPVKTSDNNGEDLSYNYQGEFVFVDDEELIKEPRRKYYEGSD